MTTASTVKLIRSTGWARRTCATSDSRLIADWSGLGFFFRGSSPCEASRFPHRLWRLEHGSKTKPSVVRRPVAGLVTQSRSDARFDALQIVLTLIGRQERREAMRERRE